MDSSIELSFTTEGECECGIPRTIGERPPRCVHRVVCVFGELQYSPPRPARGEVGHLVLTTQRYFRHLMSHGPHDSWQDGYRETRSASKVDGRDFVHLDFEGYRWSWEVHPAHWEDQRQDDVPLLIGVWRD